MRLLNLLCLVGIASAHSWVEQLTNIASNGTFVGQAGYPRGNVLRTASGYTDDDMVYLLPPDGRANVYYANDSMCRPSQQSQNQTVGSPRLQAEAGASIALRYQENGHVTLPQNQPGKPANRGTMFVYGTTQSQPSDTFLAIHNVWNTEGTGGDGRGKLLATGNFDDSRCYQINEGNISLARQAEYPFVAVPGDPMGANMWCQLDMKIPSDAPSGQPYTLYWVWEWPTLPGIDPNLPDGKNETYTACMDIDVQASNNYSQKQVTASYVTNQDLARAAIPEQFEQLGTSSFFAMTTPNAGSASVPAAATSTPATTLTTSAMTALSTPAPSNPGVETITVTDVIQVTATTYHTVYQATTAVVRRSEPTTLASSTSTVFNLRGRNPFYKALAPSNR